MKTCATCGHENQEGAQFCDACGTAFAAPVAPEETAPPVEAPPAYAPPAPPVEAPPAYAPPAPPVEAPPAYAPPAYAPPAAPAGFTPPPPAPVAAAPARSGMMPLVIGVAVVALAVAGYFAYTMLLNPAKPAASTSTTGPAVPGGPVTSTGPLSAAEYRTRAIAAVEIIQNAGASDTETIKLIGSDDPAERTAANDAWNAAAAETKRGMAELRALTPPADLQSLHDRLIAGIAATEQVLDATDTLYEMLASGEIDSSTPDDNPAIKTFTDVATDPAIATALQDLGAAFSELQAGQ